MITEVSRVTDRRLKVVVVTFADPDGSEHKVQHPLAQQGYDAAAQEQAAKDLLRANYERFNAALERQPAAAEAPAPAEPARAKLPLAQLIAEQRKEQR